jgi:Glycoside Hydrolase Family 113
MASASASQIAPSATKTPSLQSLQHAISRAHQLGLKVLLKPHVDVNDGTWRGQISPSAPDAWFNSYTQFISRYADLAQAAGADELAVGTELATMSGYAPQWRQVVATVRSRFSGPLTYAANWDEAESVSWWDALDYIGIDAYFPLSPNSASVSDLIASWQPWVAEIDALRQRFGMQVVFTELGYQSAAGSTRTPWWTGSSTVDLAGQANAYEAAFEVWSKIHWFRGFFWWDWPYVPGTAGQPPTGFSPQGKPAQQVLESWQGVFPTPFLVGINPYGSF